MSVSREKIWAIGPEKLKKKAYFGGTTGGRDEVTTDQVLLAGRLL